MKTVHKFKNNLKRRIPIPLRPNRIKEAGKGKCPYKRVTDWKEFDELFLEQQEPMPPEYNKVVDKYFWELV